MLDCMARKSKQRQRKITVGRGRRNRNVRSVNRPARRRNGRRNNWGNGGRGPVNPGSTAVTRNAVAAPQANASGAWFKSLFDPAHCRSYGCVGIPDNNKDPTVVCCGRKDVMISSNTIPPMELASSAGGVDTAEDVAWVWGKQTGGAPASIRPVYSGDTFTLPDVFHWDVVKAAIHANYGLLVYLQTSTAFKATSGGDAMESCTGLLIQYSAGILQRGTSSGYDQARPVSCSLTVEQITQWAQIGGYFTAGHLPLMRMPYDLTASGVQVDGVQVDMRWWLNRNEDFVTYTGGAAVGAYILSRPRNLDMLSLFSHYDDVPFNFGTVFGGSTVRMNGLAQDPNAWDWGFVNYIPVTSQWTLRMTMFSNYEEVRPFNEGGTDGAKLDRNCLNLAMAAMDTHEYIFAARDNDFKNVLSKVRTTIKKFRKPIVAAMGVAGAPGWATALANRLLAN